MRSYANKYKTPKYYNLKTTCHIHGWKNLAPFSWDVKKQYLSFALMANEEPVEIIVKQVNHHIVLEVMARSRLNANQKEIIDNAVVRSLDLTADTEELYKLSKTIKNGYGDLVRKGVGRILRSPTLWEDAAKTLFTTNCTWNLTKVMCNSACSSSFSLATVQNSFPFPTAERVSRASVTKIKDKMRVGYRADYLNKLAKRLKNGNDSLNIENYSENQLQKYFSSLEGFGPYATNHMLILCGFYNQIPVDTVVKVYLKSHHDTEEYFDFIENHYGKWGRYKWWGMKIEKIYNNSNWLGD